jgi:hypothetical protein
MAPHLGPFSSQKRRSTTLRFAYDDRTVRHSLLDGGLAAVAATICVPTFGPLPSIAPNIAIVISFANRHPVFADGNAQFFGDCRGGGQQNASGGKAYQDFAHFD